MNKYKGWGTRRQSNLYGKRMMLLALAGLIAPLVAHAGTYGDLTYTSDGASITISDCADTATHVIIPDTIDSLPVLNIRNYAFWRNTNLIEVTIMNSVTNIGLFSFRDCSNLTSVEIPNSVTHIDEGAFFDCSKLTSLTISSNVTYIGVEAFRGCSSLPTISVDPANAFYRNQDGILFNKDQTVLHQCPAGKMGSYEIPGSITNIADGAFNSTSMTNVAIAASVTTIGEWVFEWSTNIAAITVDTANPSFSSQNGILFNKDQTTLIQYPGGKTNSSYTIPNSVAFIGGGAFSFSYNLSDISIPNTVTNIGPAAFRDCLVTSITIPDSVVSLQWMAFFNCTNLTSITIPDSVTSIDNNSFRNCTSLTNVGIGQSVTSIGQYTFANCATLVSITIPESITTLGAYPFADCTDLSRVYFAGNAPNREFRTFDGSNHAIVYYLPGTSAWGATYDGRPTRLWNPEMQLGAGYGATTQGFSFNISGTADIPIAVEACTNLAEGHWFPLQTTNLTSGTLDFTDPDWTHDPSRVYRIAAP